MIFEILASPGSIFGGLGSLLGPLGVVLGRSWGLLGRSWAILGRSWGIFRRSGAALGAFLGGPGPSRAGKWPGPGRGGDLASDQGRKVARAAQHPKPRTRGPSQKFLS